MVNNDFRAQSSSGQDRTQQEGSEQDRSGRERIEAREQLVADLEQTQQAVARLLESMAPMQDWQPEPAEWSFRYIAAHLASVEEECHLVRMRKIAAGDTPDLPNYRERSVDFSDEELVDSLAKWQTTRRQLLEFVGELSARQLSYIGIHEKLGVVSLLDALQEIADQDQGHLRHIRRLIVAYYEEIQQPPPSFLTDGHSVSPRGQTENGVAPLYTNHKHGAM